MINKNIHRPFLLRPAGKDYLWGGDRLKKEFNKKSDLHVLAESWECSVHPEGLSYVTGGIYNGRTLKSVLEEKPEFLGSHPDKRIGFPILVKLIDARENLSIQVHPDDAYAAKYENGSLGKTEMWYVLEADADAQITYGFVRDMNRQMLLDAMESGSVEKYLQRVKTEKDDVFYVKSGTVHGIGAGCVIAEIQENSNLTYRLYDYNRLDQNGKTRKLHIEKALDVLDYGAAGNPKQPMRTLKYKRGCASELLCRCQYFQVERLLLNTLENGIKVDYASDSTSFEVLLCIEGSGQLTEREKEECESLSYQKGDCIFVPADSVSMFLTGKAQILKIHC